MDGEFHCGYISQYDNITYYRLEIFSTIASVAMGVAAWGRQHCLFCLRVLSKRLKVSIRISWIVTRCSTDNDRQIISVNAGLIFISIIARYMMLS